MSESVRPAPLSTEEVAERAGATYRMIDYWTRQGYLIPDGGGGEGIPREWSPAEAEIACRMARLVAAGLTVERAADFARYQWPSGELAARITVVVADG